MNDIIHSIAQDFSAHAMIKNVASEPIDTYLEPLYRVLGRDPDRAQVLGVLYTKCDQLAREIGKSRELELDVAWVESVFIHAIRNFYGPAIDDQLPARG